MKSLGMLLWQGVFILSYTKYLLSAYRTWCCGGTEDESTMYSALGCVDSYNLNCGCEGKGEWLLIGLMRTKL